MRWLLDILSALMPKKSRTRPAEPPVVDPRRAQGPGAQFEHPRAPELAYSRNVKLSQIDWSDPSCPISDYFTVKEALWLPMCRCLHIPSKKEAKTIFQFAKKMDKVRQFIGQPIRVHVWIRPPSINQPGNPHHGKDYNRMVYEKYVWGPKGLSKEEMDKLSPPDSPHKYGNAVDFHVKNQATDITKRKLLPELDKMRIRMEDQGWGRSWVHLDDRKPGPSGRFFKP